MYDRHMGCGKWTRDMVRTFLTNEVYRGTIVNHKSTVVNFRTKKKRNLPKERHVRVENMHEAIIDEDLWNKVREIRKTRLKSGNGENGKKHPLSGKVFCEKCGSKMYKCKSGGIEYFRCRMAASTGECDNNKRIRLDILEQIVTEKINETLSMYINGEYLSKNVTITNRLENELSDCIKRKNELKKALDDSRQSLKNLLKAYTDKVVDRSIYEEVQKDYLKEKEECQRRMAAIDEEISEIKQLKLSQEDKDSIMKKYTHINELTIPVVQEFIDSIIIGEITGQSNQRDIIINMAV